LAKTLFFGRGFLLEKLFAVWSAISVVKQLGGILIPDCSLRAGQRRRAFKLPLSRRKGWG
jgi:hypothetical protein